MIPKIIHLCWLSGDPYPEKIAKCISTWKKHLPDYEIMIWDTDRFDVNSLHWTKEAFEAERYAFVADYIRFYAVYNYGGIYLDSDVEVLKSFDDMLNLPYFVGEESMEANLEVAIFGAEKGTQWVKDAMDYYCDKHFIREDGSYEMTVCPVLIDRFLSKKYVRTMITSPAEITGDTSCLFVLPLEWLCGRKWIEEENRTIYLVTSDTHTVHHFAHSWAEFPGGPLHKIYFKLTGKDWHRHYFQRFNLIQDQSL